MTTEKSRSVDAMQAQDAARKRERAAEINKNIREFYSRHHAQVRSMTKVVVGQGGRLASW